MVILNQLKPNFVDLDKLLSSDPKKVAGFGINERIAFLAANNRMGKQKLPKDVSKLILSHLPLRTTVIDTILSHDEANLVN